MTHLRGKVSIDFRLDSGWLYALLLVLLLALPAHSVVQVAPAPPAASQEAPAASPSLDDCPCIGHGPGCC